MKDILFHQYMQKIRAVFEFKNRIINLVLLLLLFCLVSGVVFIAVNLGGILNQTFPDKDIIKEFTRFVAYYFLIAFFLRLLLQKLSVTDMQYYWLLNLPIWKIIHLPLLKTFFGILTIIAIIVVIPFFFNTVLFEKNFGFALSWLLTMICLALFNTYFTLLLKSVFENRLWVTIIVLLCLSAIIYLDYYGHVRMSMCFTSFVFYVSQHPAFIFIPLLITILFYALLYYRLVNKKYIYHGRSAALGGALDISAHKLMNPKDLVGNLVLLEMKMVFRNKKPKATYIVGALFVLYGFIFYQLDVLLENDILLLGIGVMLTGIFILQYGQTLFAWESSFFDGLISGYIPSYDYIISKYWFIVINAVIGFILMAPYAFFGLNILIVNLVCLLVNISITPYFLIFFNSFNTRRVDLSKGVFMNYEGVGSAQFILLIPIIGLPLLIFFPFHYYDLPRAGLAMLAGIGVIGYSLRNPLCLLLASRWQSKKYQMSDGFRKRA